MGQVSWRADDEIITRVKRAARKSDRSLNEFMTLVLAAATDPDTAGTEAQAIRERLAAAGLLAVSSASPGRRPSRAALDAAGKRAATGTALDKLMARGR
ncbi:MAG: transcriptional regulator [Acidimicrobiia bacterium]